MKQIAAFLIVLLLLVPLPTSAQDFCEGNFDYDDDVDGSDAFTFKTDFGRSLLKNPCPPDGPAPVQQTGQTRCWNDIGVEIPCQTCIPGAGGCTNKTGQDGMWEKGVELPEPRFTVNGDGTVTDNLTGLFWLRNANCFGQKTWQEALDDCNDLSAGYCGLTDGSNPGEWRLSNRRELFSLIHDGYSLPALSNTAGTGHWVEGDPFTNIQYTPYWSATTMDNDRYFAWWVSIRYGFVFYESKNSDSGYVWCVRGGH
jgi:hypothetical protein